MAIAHSTATAGGATVARMQQLLIADDHPLFRAALRQAAAAALPLARIDEAADLAGALAMLQAQPETDLVLLDLHMPGSRGLSGLAALRGQHPGVAVLVVSAHDDARVVRRVLDHGAAVRTVLGGGQWLPANVARAVAALPVDPADTALAGRLARLTEQQSRVLGLLAEGLLNKQIADRLGIQERTVKSHVTAIFEKLEVRNRTQAGVLLRSLDLGEPARM